MRAHYVRMGVAALMLVPPTAMAGPASCRLGEASFRPLRGAHKFEFRSRRPGDAVAWDLMVSGTGETYPFRTEVRAPSREWVLVSEADSKGVDPKIRTAMSPIARMAWPRRTASRSPGFPSSISHGASWRTTSGWDASQMAASPRHPGCGC